MIRLYGYWRSSATWRVRIALHLKGLPFEVRPVHLLREGGEQHREAFRALNPMEQVPVLELEDPHGRPWRISQSLAIVELIEELHPEPPLLPREPFLRARARQLAEVVNSGIQPLQNLYVLQRLRDELGADEAAWARHFVERGLGALERMAREGEGPFLVGERPTLADLCLVPQLYNARRFGVDVEAYPTLLRAEAACAALPAFQAAHPDRQPDARPAP